MEQRRGRPKKTFPTELIQDIIYRYTKERKVTGKITYMDVYRYSKELFENGEIEHNIGEFFGEKAKDATQLIKQIKSCNTIFLMRSKKMSQLLIQTIS